MIKEQSHNSVSFLMVGLVCAITHNAIMLTLDHWRVHYTASSGLSYAIVVLIGYALHARFTFGQPATVASFWRYALGMTANYPLTLGLLWLQCDVFGWPVAAAAPVATLVLMAWNFCASRWAIVRDPKTYRASSS